MYTYHPVSPNVNIWHSHNKISLCKCTVNIGAIVLSKSWFLLKFHWLLHKYLLCIPGSKLWSQILFNCYFFGFCQSWHSLSLPLSSMTLKHLISSGHLLWRQPLDWVCVMFLHDWDYDWDWDYAFLAIPQK